MRENGLSNLDWIEASELEVGDVVVPQVGKSLAIVIYRESDNHHSLLLTNRCNSYCLMCSQPPTRNEDSWLVNEAIDVVRHISRSPRVLGLSGGEPLLLGNDLRRVLDAIVELHPDTQIEVLTNGRLFSDPQTSSGILLGLNSNVSWLVPLYGHADFFHDFVVQTPGAFEETIAGLLNLREHDQRIQLRIVLIEPVLRNLQELSSFIGRNLPFVHEVAMMACEPIGFALANRDLCEVDLLNWTLILEQASRTLTRYKVPFLFMNTPLCALPEHLWPAAHKSISDWKSVFADECTTCAVKDECSGLFAWHERGWKPAKIRPIQKAIA